jgi:hypothetical protein
VLRDLHSKLVELCWAQFNRKTVGLNEGQENNNGLETKSRNLDGHVG